MLNMNSRTYNVYTGTRASILKYLTWEEAKRVYENAERKARRGGQRFPILLHNDKEADPYVYGIGLKWEEDHASGELSSVGIPV